MKCLKYIFMGTPPLAATILSQMMDKYARPELVVTQVARSFGRGQSVKPTAVEELARAQKIPFLSVEDVNQPDVVSQLSAVSPDLVLVAAFGQILKEEILKLPKRYCLNVHASLLPRYRGAAPIQRAILDGCNETGVTIQQMARKLDTGDIMLAKAIAISAGDTAETLTSKLATLGGDCLLEAVRQIEAGGERLTPQDHASATYAKKLDKSEAPVDWSRSAKEIADKIRGLQPWPVAETLLGGDRVRLFGSAPIELPGKPGSPGSLATDAKTFLAVWCGDGRALSLTQIQLENRKKIDVKDFLKAFRGAFPHQKLGSSVGKND